MLYPPVDTEFFTPGPPLVAGHFLVVSALVPYKRIDRAIAAANRLAAPLVIVGSGPDDARLRALCRRFGSVCSARWTRQRFATRTDGPPALVLPGEEDFGIAPVEAMACGRPVVALGRGGATETVVPGVTGSLVDDESVESLADAMRDVDERAFDASIIRAHAESFGTHRFEAAMAGLIDEARHTRLPC